MGAQVIGTKQVFLRRRERRGDLLVMGGTAGSQKRARLLRRAAAVSSPKALLAAAVAVAAPRLDFDKVLSITCAGDPCQKYLWGTLGAQVIDRKKGNRPQT